MTGTGKAQRIGREIDAHGGVPQIAPRFEQQALMNQFQSRAVNGLTTQAVQKDLLMPGFPAYLVNRVS